MVPALDSVSSRRLVEEEDMSVVNDDFDKKYDMSLLRFKFAIAKIRFLKAASKIISFIATNYTFKHNNSNILVQLEFSREWCNRTNRTPYKY